MKLQYFLCAKITTLLNNFSSVPVFDVHSLQYIMMHACTFFCLQTSRSAAGFYIRMPAASNVHVMVFSQMCGGELNGRELLNEVVIFVFFAH